MEINKIQILIRSFLHETKDVVLDTTKSQEWLKKFRDTLNYQDLEADPMPYALALLNEADSFNKSQKLKQMQRWAKYELLQEGITNPTKEQIIQKCKDKYNGEFAALTQNLAPPQPQSKTPVVNPQPRRNKPFPKDKQIVIDWAIDNGIDVDDACECWEATTERNGCDQDGNTVKNWEAFVKQWCKTRRQKRKENNK